MIKAQSLRKEGLSFLFGEIVKPPGIDVWKAPTMSLGKKQLPCPFSSCKNKSCELNSSLLPRETAPA